MLKHYRRLWVIAIVALLATPLATGFFMRTTDFVARNELREVAPLPAFPRTLHDLVALPRAVDRYLADRFGLRELMVVSNAFIRHDLLRAGNSSVLIGTDGSLFYTEANTVDTVKQSAGKIRRSAELDETVRILTRVNKALSERGIRFLVAIPPNRSTIYPDLLPTWARDRKAPTEYDLLLKSLRAHAVDVVDLRPILKAAAARESVYYQEDTHWNWPGALSAYNAIASAAGHPDWQLHPRMVTKTKTGGDLARMLGFADWTSEPDPAPALAPGSAVQLSPDPRPTVSTSLNGEAKPHLLVIGDSYTEEYFAPFAVQRVGTFSWLYLDLCGFDWRWIERLAPDEVWWMPTERNLVCLYQRTPINLPE